MAGTRDSRARRILLRASLLCSLLIIPLWVISTQVCYAYGFGRSHVRLSDGMLQIYIKSYITPGWHRFDAIGDTGLHLPVIRISEFKSDFVLPLWIILVVSVGISIACYSKRRKTRPNACTQCGYNLTGNVSGICPECGTRISRKHLVGKSGSAVSPVSAHEGKVKIEGAIYEAATAGPIEVIDKGRSVVVRAFRGSTLIVTPTSDGLKYK